MKSFVYDGVEYRSLHVFANENHISYQKLRRLIRHYVSANKDPIVACDWILGKKPLLVSKELKTKAYYEDLAKAKVRSYKQIERDREVYETNLRSQIEDYLND